MTQNKNAHELQTRRGSALLDGVEVSPTLLSSGTSFTIGGSLTLKIWSWVQNVISVLPGVPN